MFDFVCVRAWVHVSCVGPTCVRACVCFGGKIDVFVFFTTLDTCWYIGLSPASVLFQALVDVITRWEGVYAAT